MKTSSFCVDLNIVRQYNDNTNKYLGREDL